MTVAKVQNTETHAGSREVFAAVLLVLLIFALAVFSIDNSCYWGDDFAAYISQGIAMAEGRLDEQAALNIKMHPSPLPAEAIEGDELVYVWGYPLILSLVYRISGFDRAEFGSIIYYKLPSVLALALLAAVLFCFYRRRFGLRLSFLLALLFCCCTEMFDFLNTIYSDMLFLFLAMLSLYLCELFLERSKTSLALLLGACLWFMYEVRLNGVSILLCCMLAQAVAIFTRRRELKRAETARSLLPYAVFLLLVFVSHALIGRATPNTSDIGSGMSIAAFLDNLKSYFKLIWHWLGLLWNSILINPLYSVSRRFFQLSFESFKPLRDVLVAASLVLFASGLCLDGKGKNLHLSILTIVYIIIVSSLPYTQGLRYIYPLLPLVLMFIGHALERAAAVFSRPPRRFFKLGTWLITAICCLFIIYPHVSAALSGDKGVKPPETFGSPSDIYMQNAYSQDAVEIYRYIQEETDETDVIAFFAPRALHLNTQRVALRPGVNGHSAKEADYYLEYLSVGNYPVDRPPEEGFLLCFENSQFRLYENVGK